MTDAGIGPAAGGRAATLVIVVEHVAERRPRQLVSLCADGNKVPVYRLVWLLGQVKAEEQTYAIVAIEVLSEDGSAHDGAIDGTVISHV